MWLANSDRGMTTRAGGSTFKLGLGDMLAMNPADLTAVAGDSVRDGAVLVRAKDGANLNAVMNALADAGGDQVGIEGSATQRAMGTRMLDVMVLVAMALLGVGVLIALVGIANTLSLSVIERGREHALLRGLGLTRRQLRATLLIEAALLALVSAGLGLALGLLYGWLGVATILPADTGVRLALPWERLGLVVLVVLVAGVLASVLPARRAAQVSPISGMAAA